MQKINYDGLQISNSICTEISHNFRLKVNKNNY